MKDEWKDHGTNIGDSGGIWLAVIGPDTPAEGEAWPRTQLYQKQWGAIGWPPYWVLIFVRRSVSLMRVRNNCSLIKNNFYVTSEQAAITAVMRPCRMKDKAGGICAGEKISQLEHMVQSAQLAEEQGHEWSFSPSFPHDNGPYLCVGKRGSGR